MAQTERKQRKILNDPGSPIIIDDSSTPVNKRHPVVQTVRFYHPAGFKRMPDPLPASPPYNYIVNATADEQRVIGNVWIPGVDDPIDIPWLLTLGTGVTLSANNNATVTLTFPNDKPKETIVRGVITRLDLLTRQVGSVFASASNGGFGTSISQSEQIIIDLDLPEARMARLLARRQAARSGKA